MYHYIPIHSITFILYYIYIRIYTIYPVCVCTLTSESDRSAFRRLQLKEVVVVSACSPLGNESDAALGRHPGAAGCHVFVQCDTHWNGCAGDCNRLASYRLRVKMQGE